jgi:hypothetical protein
VTLVALGPEKQPEPEPEKQAEDELCPHEPPVWLAEQEQGGQLAAPARLAVRAEPEA